ncbi:formylglycine-generating enzyme family protein, partial [Myxococcota bacterium]|nr:formylglycine-generating enzyme family protein [Myxococcota bacterium]
MSLRAAALPVLAAGLFAGGCFASIDLGHLDAGAVADAGPDAGGCDAGSLCDLACAAGYTELPGAEGVCVHTAAVTNAEYAAFLDARGGDTSGQPSECRWNDRLEPDVWPFADGAGAEPVTDVDWCDVWTFCRSAGAEPCGRIDGAALALGSVADPGVSVWAAACRAGHFEGPAPADEWLDACEDAPGASGANDDCAPARADCSA